MLISLSQVHTLDFEYRMLWYARCFDYSEFGSYEWTEFWLFKPTSKKQKRWFLFGKIDEVVNVKPDFKLRFDICNPHFSKKQIREAIQHEIEIINRAKELSDGNII